MRSFLLLPCAVLALTACNSALPPTVDAADVEADRLEGRRFQKLAETARADLPRGQASYAGRLGGQITGDMDGRMIADLALDIDFADNLLDGSVTNINLTDRDGVPTQRLGGRLDIDGVEADGSLDARAVGQLRINDKDGNFGLTDMTLILDGDVSTQFEDGDAVAGVMSGTAAGDLTLTVFDGYFYGAQN